MFKRLLSFVAIGLVVGVTACVDDNTTIEPTPIRDAQFVGYSDADSKQTTCGNCHVGKQNEWADTRHANAWATVADRPNASTSCAACHTTNGTSSGDSTNDRAGYFAVNADSKSLYHDVQCESCHGAGSVHVLAPEDATPIIGIRADTGMTEGCVTCHSGTHNPFAAEWRSTRHGEARASLVTRPECASCHDGRAWLATYAPDAEFTEQTAGATAWQGITCATCHDPHGSDNVADLRLSPASLDEETNLCITCHHKRGEPDLTTYRGPHSPQGPMVLGTAGWLPPGFTWDNTAMGTSHASPTANPGLCAGCHVSAFSRVDTTTNATVYSTGHTFAAIPCLNAGGAPDYTVDDCDVTARTFQSCSKSGCHSTENAARSAFVAAEDRFTFYSRLMWIDVNANSRVDAFPTDSGMAALARRDFPDDFPTRSTTNAPPLSPGEGLAFNGRLLIMPGQAAHNAFYGEALAIATLNAARARYGYAVPPAVAARLEARAAALRLTTTR